MANLSLLACPNLVLQVLPNHGPKTSSTTLDDGALGVDLSTPSIFDVADVVYHCL